MRLNFYLLLFCITTLAAHAQDSQSPSLNLGDAAPPLYVREWFKGEPVQKFEKGKVYVVEFWATWCHGCILAMPHLSDLRREYQDKVTVIAMDIMEEKVKLHKSVNKIKAFVDSMGSHMDFCVAAQDSNLMQTNWIEAAGEEGSGIPITFVVDTEKRLAWIGRPYELDEALRKIVNNTWDIEKALTIRDENKRLEKLDYEANDSLYEYITNPRKHDSTLFLIDEIVKREPKLQYAPFIGSATFSLLLEKDMHKAYEFGKTMLSTPTYEDPPWNLIIGTIEWRSKKTNLLPKIYELGADAYQVEINQIVYPELVDFSKLYYKMAEMYWHAKDKTKAIETMQKAIEALKSEKSFSKQDMAAFESRLQQYRKI